MLVCKKKGWLNEDFIITLYYIREISWTYDKAYGKAIGYSIRHYFYYLGYSYKFNHYWPFHWYSISKLIGRGKNCLDLFQIYK